ncbi:Peptidylprolyl isomerase domain and WD repeat-containing protein 1 [Seminavis robusta]|uniref:Peptidyl-prolyl cis-trans isomerase n=1 Tax=Seminavis robusta TaxID=568900 RepID=A0A9N8DS99_9STRA|nr:Peptidylprolyl isomerase domain and WD repeat-containing protein 1 [Seminavis robusta]|eukprot:Sro334_g119780.1 Peptidylprolyl isomerase domain and WD repeat-containing protein 1 (167) ;mRNA; f:34651-35257
MIQGGKPPKNSSDNSDECYWGGSFRDEFDDRLKHTAPGILSMANAGQHTNKRQFFFTFAPCEHLDKKHSIFGVVIKGLDALKELEKIPTDKKDRPMKEITIADTIVVDNPVEEAEEMERKRIEAKQKAAGKAAAQQESASAGAAKPLRQGKNETIGRIAQDGGYQK